MISGCSYGSASVGEKGCFGNTHMANMMFSFMYDVFFLHHVFALIVSITYPVFLSSYTVNYVSSMIIQVKPVD